jgi:cytosine/adenosine deaminase-related metal-dependent hydrolase
VALGTDSRASNPDLSIWNELQFLARHTNTLPADDLLAMATSTPAAALGIEHDCGSLAPGKQATAIGLQPDPNTPLTLTSLLECGRIAGVLRRGRWQAA